MFSMKVLEKVLESGLPFPLQCSIFFDVEAYETRFYCNPSKLLSSFFETVFIYRAVNG